MNIIFFKFVKFPRGEIRQSVHLETTFTPKLFHTSALCHCSIYNGTCFQNGRLNFYSFHQYCTNKYFIISLYIYLLSIDYFELFRFTCTFSFSCFSICHNRYIYICLQLCAQIQFVKDQQFFSNCCRYFYMYSLI